MIVLAVMTVVTAAIVAVVRVLLNPTVGRAPAGAPVATSPPVPVTSTSVRTSALAPPPPGFPDLDGFTDVSQGHDVSRHYALATFTSDLGDSDGDLGGEVVDLVGQQPQVLDEPQCQSPDHGAVVVIR